MDIIYVDRFQRIIDHLRTGKLSADEFRFNRFRLVQDCGTSGCAMGEFPTIFPEDFRYLEDSIDRRRPDIQNIHTSVFNVDAVREYLNMDHDLLFDLFYPSSNSRAETYYLDIAGFKKLDSLATKEEVAANLELFLKIRQEIDADN